MKYVIGNWKMHTTVEQAVALAGQIEDGVADLARGGRTVPEVVICPPFTALSAVHDVIRDPSIKLGAQNCHWEDQGAYTGEIGPAMLVGLADFVLLGHSERRRAGESDELIGRKLGAARRHGLTPLLFIGEQESSDDPTEATSKQLEAALAAAEAPIDRLFVAYEPVWEVGGESATDPERITEVVDRLNPILAAAKVNDRSFVYGGSVTAQNARALVGLKKLSGLLVGHESLDAEHFINIVEVACDD